MSTTIVSILTEQVLVPLMITLIGAVVTWAAQRFHAWTGIQIEAKHREALQSALENGAIYALDLLIERGGQIDLRDPALMRQLLEDAIGYVRDSVPDAIGFFGLDDFGLTKLLRPKIPVLTEEEARALTGYDGPIENRTGTR